MRTSLIALPCLLLVCACAPAPMSPPPVEPAAEPAEIQLVRSMGDAFNAHDVEALVAHTAPGIEWLYVAGDEVAVEARGHEALRKSMTGYFASLPSARSEIENAMVSGSYVTVTERAHWTDREGNPRSQAALAIYEIDDDLVRRVWYFPAGA